MKSIIFVFLFQIYVAVSLIILAVKLEWSVITREEAVKIIRRKRNEKKTD